MNVVFKTEDWPGCPRCFKEFVNVVHPDISTDGTVRVDISATDWISLTAEIRDAITYILTQKHKKTHGRK